MLDSKTTLSLLLLHKFDQGYCRLALVGNTSQQTFSHKGINLFQKSKGLAVMSYF